MVSKADKKLIKEIVIVKIIIVTAFLILVFPLIPVEMEQKSGIDLIIEHFGQSPALVDRIGITIIAVTIVVVAILVIFVLKICGKSRRT